MKGLVPTQIRSASNCLFMSAGGKSLVHLEGVDTEEQMKRLFWWGDSSHNFYSNFSPSLLDQQPTGTSDAMPPPPYGKTQWESFTGEQDARFERLRLNTPLTSDTPLTKVVASDFRAKSEANLQGYGAELDALPKPADVSRGHGVTP